jgi:hypothetical protein
MTSPPIACSLDAAALGDREAEFRALFAGALRSADRTDGRSSRLVFEAEAAEAVRDLFAREQRCCAFFDFSVEVAGDAVVVEARVPADAEASLDYLLSLAPAVTPRPRA